ncbi:protein containing Electron transfer flavoprotein, alpha/beta-subunit, partial [mine drainage metagenome]
AVAYGPAPRTPEVLRSCLALGCDSAVHLESAEPVDDPLSAAAALGAVLGSRPADLILVGKQALDDEEGLVAPALGALLDRPAFSSVTDLRWSPDRSRFTFRRATDAEIEHWEAPAPLVIGLQQAWNDPRTAKLPNILKARRQPIETRPGRRDGR